jgi:cytochrome c peroxidase
MTILQGYFRTMRKHLALMMCTGALLAITAGSALAVGQRRMVDQSGLRFSAALLHLHRGDTVVFTNSDRSSHNITIQGARMNFNGGLQRPGQAVEVPITAIGSYQVICGIHPRMRMQIEVE